jgi:hypothetical protein
MRPVVDTNFAEDEHHYPPSLISNRSVTDRLLDTASQNGTSFECFQCMTTIEAGLPIYMRNDFTFCSKACREKGIAPFYQLMLLESGDIRDARMLSAFRDRTSSLSSLASSETAEKKNSASNIISVVSNQAKQLLQRIVRSASTTSIGSSIFRTYSTSVVWGKDLTRNTSLNMLFTYLPDIEEICKSPPQPSSGRAESVGSIALASDTS